MTDPSQADKIEEDLAALTELVTTQGNSIANLIEAVKKLEDMAHTHG